MPVIRAHVRNGLLPVHGVTGGEEEAKTGDAAASAVRVVVRFIDSVGAVVDVVPFLDVGRALLLVDGLVLGAGDGERVDGLGV